MNSPTIPMPHFILAEAQRLFPPRGSLSSNGWEAYAWTVPCLLALGVLTLALVLRHRKTPPPPPRPCADIAHDRLASLRGMPNQGVMAANVAGILCEYVIARTQLPSVKYTRQELIGTLKSARGTLEAWELLDSVLAECERINFAPRITDNSSVQDAPSNELLAKATRLIDVIEAAHESTQQTSPPP